jgi:hypothetical protein
MPSPGSIVSGASSRRVFQMSTSAVGAGPIVAKLPGRILNCAAASTRRYTVCTVDESRSDAWIIDDFDPRVSSPHSDKLWERTALALRRRMLTL